MVLVDTSVWVDHFRHRNKSLEELLSRDVVFIHPLIIGELACGNLHNRGEILTLLKELPSADIITHHEAVRFIEQHRLMGKGLSIVDVYLLASAVVSDLKILTEDKVMKQTAGHLGILY